MSSFFDKKFVITALIIAFLYTTVIIFINAAIGKEAAGVAGVALTALATALFKQFETLRFKRAEETSQVISYSFNFWQMLLLAIFFASLSYNMLDQMDDFLVHVLKNYESFDSVPEGTNRTISSVNGRIIVYTDIWPIGVECFAFFIGGLLVAKAWRRLSYSVVIFAALFGILIDFYNQYLVDILLGDGKFSDLKDDLSDYKYSFLYVIFAFIGFFLVQSNRKKV